MCRRDGVGVGDLSPRTPLPVPRLPAPAHPSLLDSGALELPHAEPRRIPVVQDNSWKEAKGEPVQVAPGEAPGVWQAQQPAESRGLSDWGEAVPAKPQRVVSGTAGTERT